METKQSQWVLIFVFLKFILHLYLLLGYHNPFEMYHEYDIVDLSKYLSPVKFLLMYEGNNLSKMLNKIIFILYQFTLGFVVWVYRESWTKFELSISHIQKLLWGHLKWWIWIFFVDREHRKSVLLYMYHELSIIKYVAVRRFFVRKLWMS